MSRVEKIVGRLLLTDQINSEEAVILLGGLYGTGDNSEESAPKKECSCDCGCYRDEYCDCECGCHNKKYATESDYNLEEMSMDECLEKLGFIPDEVLKRHGLEQLVDGGNSEGCNIPNCSCKNEKYSLPSVGPFSITNVAEYPYSGDGSVSISMMQHQSYCKSKGALASEDCICCHYTYNSGTKSERKTLLD